MGKEREWREDFQMEIGWNVGQSRNGWSHHNQTWNLSGHFVDEEHKDLGDVAAAQMDRNGKTGQIGVDWWWGSQGVDFEDSVWNESLILHQMFVKKRTDQHRLLQSQQDSVVKTHLQLCKMVQWCRHEFCEL